MTEPEAAVAILRSRAADSILLIRRAERAGDSWSGHWSFPGGRRDPQDPDLVDTALRELEEECGIRLAREQFEASLPPVTARRKTEPFVLVAPFLFRVDGEPEATLDPREAVESLWVPLSLLLDPAQHRLRPGPGRPEQMLYPAIDLNGVPLWGFTYRLITDWLGLGPKHRPVEQAGFEAACAVLDFLLSQGLALGHGWAGRGPGKTAAVKGAIPVQPVLDRFSGPGPWVAAVNCLEVHPGSVRLTGPAFEDYVITASPAAPR